MYKQHIICSKNQKKNIENVLNYLYLVQLIMLQIFTSKLKLIIYWYLYY